jgi:hypothetical protein
VHVDCQSEFQNSTNYITVDYLYLSKDDYTDVKNELSSLVLSTGCEEREEWDEGNQLVPFHPM